MKVCPSCKGEYAGGEVFCPNDGARLYTASQLDLAGPLSDLDPLIGTVLSDRYKILRQIGEGGMGLVYEAEHVTIEKRVALKVLRDDFSSRDEVVERFKQEAKSASKIGNAHIVDISDFGSTPEETPISSWSSSTVRTWPTSWPITDRSTSSERPPSSSSAASRSERLTPRASSIGT